jgi:hypothetical protein
VAAVAALLVGFSSVVLLVALTARSIIEMPEADGRRQSDAGPAATRSSTAEKSASRAKESRRGGVSGGGEAEGERAGEGKRAPAVDPWAGAVPINLGKVRLSVVDGQKLGKRTEEFLRQYNQARPADPRGHLLLAAMFLNRNWVSDAITHYDLAYRIDPGCRGDPDMLRNLLLIAAEKSVGPRANGLIRKVYGPEALPALDRAMGKYERDGRAVKRLRLLRASLVD